jgi:tRNA nucleotidyltransferase/poly(A) polymerase
MGRGGDNKKELDFGPRGLDMDALRYELKSLAESLDLDAYEVGGCMRDEYAGRPVKDIDVCVCGKTYDELAALLSKEGGIDPLETKRKTGEFDEKGQEITESQLVGLRFYPKWGPKEGFEFALARTEVSLGAGSHKDFAIVPDPNLTIDEDLERRDFTINAIARSLRDGKIYDPYNGVEDIKNGLIRTVTEDSFRDDSLRILRVFPRMAKDGFKPAPETLEQMKKYAPLLAEQSAERVREELEKTLSGDYAADALRLARDMGLLQSDHVLPEFAAAIGYDQQSKYHSLTCDEHILLAVERACAFDAPIAVRWAALLHDVGKPVMGWEGKDGHRHFYGNPGDREQTKTRVRELRAKLEELENRAEPKTKKERFILKNEIKETKEQLDLVRSGRVAIDSEGNEIDGRGHEFVGGEMAATALERLKHTNDTIDYVRLLVEEHMYSDDDKLDAKHARRFLARIAKKSSRKGIDPRLFADDLLLLRRCDRAAKHSGELKEGWNAELVEFEKLVQAAKSTPLLAKELPVTGEDAQRFGFKNQEVGETLKGLLKEVIGEPEKNNREILLQAMAKKAIKEKRFGISSSDAIALGLSGPSVGRAMDALAKRVALNPTLTLEAARLELKEIVQEIAAL